MARKASRGTTAATLERGVPVSARLEQPIPAEPSAPVFARMSNLGGPGAIPGRKIVTMGWLPDWQSPRDYTLETPAVADELKKRQSILYTGTNRLPTSVDNRAWCSPVEDQGNLGSCTAQATVGALEYLMRRAHVANYDGSRLFVYKVARNLLGWTGDTGAFLRTSIQAAANFGVPPEANWPYDISRFEEEPTSFLYSYAENFKAVRYARLDPTSTNRHATVTQDIVLDNIKHALQGGYPVVFGFTVYKSISNSADIPYPGQGDQVAGGHAVMAVGYDDNHRTAAGEDEPSLIIRNSWGTGWGDAGYGFLPYRYVLKGFAQDFWAVFQWKWIDQGQFS